MLKALFSKPYKKLYIVNDNAGWAIDEEARALHQITKRLHFPSFIVKKFILNLPQAVHYVSQFSLKYPQIFKSRHRISIDYFHGMLDEPSFRDCYESLKKNHQKISKVRVSTKAMEHFIRQSGIDEEKVMRIPIGVDLVLFQPLSQEGRRLQRDKLGIPQDAFVIGSFQKDGIGWGDGNEPKLIKGPDVFLKVVRKLKDEIPNLWVLLSGPSRGYVKNGLKQLGVPFIHLYVNKYEKVSELYDALDLYLITSREEGGPKACLEAMAKGVPLVTTSVGQCADLITSGENAMMTGIDDVFGLIELTLALYRDKKLRDQIVINGFRTAEANSLNAQVPLWQEFFKNIIDP